MFVANHILEKEKIINQITIIAIVILLNLLIEHVNFGSRSYSAISKH